MYALVIVIIIVHWTCQCFLPPGNQSKFYKFAWTMYIHIVIAIVTHVTYLRSWFPPKSWSQSHWQGRCQELCLCLPPKIASNPLYPWQKDGNGHIEASKRAEHVASVHHLPFIALRPFVHEYSLESYQFCSSTWSWQVLVGASPSSMWNSSAPHCGSSSS